MARNELTDGHLLVSGMEDSSRITHCSKVFVYRDYSDGTAVRFLNKFPPELEGKIEKSKFTHTLEELNRMYSQAESLSARTYCESCFACLTAYLSYLCIDTYYEKMLKKISRFVQEQNETVYGPRGLVLIDPTDRGLRVVEFCILNDR